MKMELRVNKTELGVNGDDTLTVSGYVNKTNQYSEVLGVSKKFKEKITKGAFTRAIRNAKRDIDFLAEHKGNLILASTRNGSLELREDEQGLFMSANITPTTWGKDYYELISSGILKNMSFGFRTIKDSWKKINSDLYERTIEELELYEVSVVKDPAYSQSTIAARSIEIIAEPEIKMSEQENQGAPSVNSEFKLRLNILEKEEEVHKMEETSKLYPERDYLKKALKRETDKLNELKESLNEAKKKMEEHKMEKENRYLNVKEDVKQLAPDLVDKNIVEKTESTSTVYAKARKIPFMGEEMKIAYETNLEDAAFVNEEQSIPEIKLSVDSFATISQKRVGLSMSFSKTLMYSSGADLTEYVKKLLARRVVKAIEKSILTGDGITEFKGIAKDDSVLSKNVGTAVTIKDLRNIYLDVHEDFIAKSSWYMSRPFFEKVAELKENGSEYYVKNVLVDGRIVPTLFGCPIEISNALENGDITNEVPVLFGSIEECYTVGVSSELQIKPIEDGLKAITGVTGFVAEFYGDGVTTNYQAIAKGIVA